MKFFVPDEDGYIDLEIVPKSIKKSSPTIKKDPQRMDSHLFWINRLDKWAVRKVSTTQLMPIKKGTP